MSENFEIKKKGISLIVLVITIIIIIILAGQVILSLSENNPIPQAAKAIFIDDIRNFQSELDLYVTKQFLDNQGIYNSELLQADSGSITYDGVVDFEKTINDLIPSLGKSVKYDEQFVVINGKIVFQGSDIQQQDWIQEIGFELFTSNKPVLSDGMTAKKWNGSSWITVNNPNTDTTWYDYKNKQWANVQTEDGSMWVWIPRYEYMITSPHTSTAQTISINFLNNIESAVTPGYTLHPAFTFGSTELTGIWVAKFEASGSIDAVEIKPGVSSLRYMTIGNMYRACRNMETTNGNRYGWGTSGVGIDTHLMKNIEWGAVTYLSSSIYGKTGEVWINPNTSYITGHSGTSENTLGTATTYAYDDSVYGMNASTTGNIYGIYDMSGGAWEYTAAYLDNGNPNLTTNGNDLFVAPSQYKDVYLKGTSDTKLLNYDANLNKKGDAMYETSIIGQSNTSWYSDYSNMPNLSNTFIFRGGFYNNEYAAGVFSFAYITGNANNFTSFRPVLVVSSML